MLVALYVKTPKSPKGDLPPAKPPGKVWGSFYYPFIQST